MFLNKINSILTVSFSITRKSRKIEMNLYEEKL